MKDILIKRLAELNTTYDTLLSQLNINSRVEFQNIIKDALSHYSSRISEVQMLLEQVMKEDGPTEPDGTVAQVETGMS